MNLRDEALQKHEEWQGKLEVTSKVKVDSRQALAVAYTPGVAEPCKEIAQNKEDVYKYTMKGNTVAVISDGTAVLGLGDIGPEAAMPVMVGKAVLFKEFAGINAIPICIDTKDTEEIIKFVKQIAPTFGGINLEDISAPRCIEIEERLKKELNIPVFHDDQHGTAIVVGAALMNALKLADKKIEDIKVVLNGAGAAGIAISKYLMKLGVRDLIAVDRFGIIVEGDTRFNEAQQELAKITNRNKISGTLKEAMVGADVFVGVSVANVVTKEMVKTMNEKAILFPLANPVPEISYEDAKEAGAFIVGTGSSEKPNQINNVLVFPGLFRGALDVRASTVNQEMMIAASKGIMSCVSEEELNTEYILPYAWDERAHASVAKHVSEAAVATKVNKIKVD